MPVTSVPRFTSSSWGRKPRVLYCVVQLLVMYTPPSEDKRIGFSQWPLCERVWSDFCFQRGT